MLSEVLSPNVQSKMEALTPQMATKHFYHYMYLITWGKAVFANVSNWGAKECWETDFLFEKSHQLKICQLKIDKMYLTLNCVLLHLLKYLTWDTWSAEKRLVLNRLIFTSLSTTATITNFRHVLPEGHKPNYNLI